MDQVARLDKPVSDGFVLLCIHLLVLVGFWFFWHIACRRGLEEKVDEREVKAWVFKGVEDAEVSSVGHFVPLHDDVELFVGDVEFIFWVWVDGDFNFLRSPPVDHSLRDHPVADEQAHIITHRQFAILRQLHLILFGIITLGEADHQLPIKPVSGASHYHVGQSRPVIFNFGGRLMRGHFLECRHLFLLLAPQQGSGLLNEALGRRVGILGAVHASLTIYNLDKE